jgi:hypothetical protein
MHRHRPAHLEGPLSRSRPVWRQRPHSAATEPDPNVRQELVDRIRREIAEGVYDTPEKWEQALDRLWEELNEDE